MPLLKANNLFVSNSFFIFIMRFFPSLANLLVIVWYSRNLPPALYGGYQLFWIQLFVIYPFICFGIHSLIVTYSRNMLANILSRFTARHYLLFGSWVFLLSVIFGWLQHSTNDVGFVTSLLFILTFSISLITEALLVVFRKYGLVSLTGFIYALAFCAVHWFALKGAFSLQFVFSSLLIFNLLRLFTYSCAILLEVKKDKEGYSEEPVDMRAIRALWVHLGIYDIVQMLSSWIDKFVIALLLTAELSAIYYNGAQNVPFLPLLMAAASSAVLLQLAESSRHTEVENTISLVNQSARLLSCIVFPVFYFLFLFRSELFVNVFSEKYIPAIPIFAVSVFVIPLRAYSFSTVLQRLHKGSIINIGAVGELILACLLMYPLYLRLGLPGVALSFVVSTYFQAAFYLAFTGRFLGVSPLKLVPVTDWLIKLIVFGCALIAIHYIGSLYFTGRFTLILGALAMVVLVIASLLFEISRQKKNGRVAA
jgi:O-antigen/teichoic acid export membrane protein